MASDAGLMAFGAFISMDTGYAHDLPAEKRREIVAVLEHFVESVV